MVVRNQTPFKYVTQLLPTRGFRFTFREGSQTRTEPVSVREGGVGLHQKLSKGKKPEVHRVVDIIWVS